MRVNDGGGYVFVVVLLAAALFGGCATSPPQNAARIVDVAQGWAANSVNATVFRKNSLVTHGQTQYIAFYDKDGYVVLGKRALGADAWALKRSAHRGNAADAHNSISIMVDGAGHLHMAWDQHNNRLRYARGASPGSLDLNAKTPMIGSDEAAVTYPEFHRLPDGNLLFLYRDGGSGRGNLVMNRYDLASGAWTRLHNNLIGGEGKRNAYWQAFLDHKGTFHLSWVWRESPDVASNHDMGYARSRDGGVSWTRSDGTAYQLPITAAGAEYAMRIAQNSELINQTSMAADKHGNPYIASYWREAGSTVPQYQVVFHSGGAWKRLSLDFRAKPFSLSGHGTKAIPISRPQIMVDIQQDKPSGVLVFRDEERGSKVSVVRIDDFRPGGWSVHDLTNTPVGAWEPSFDTELWRDRGELNLFLQDVRQVDGEGLASVKSSTVQVLVWRADKPNAPQPVATKAEVRAALELANNYWQSGKAPEQSAFWDVAAYHTGNMEAYRMTGNEAWRGYSTAWAEHNKWSSAANSTNKAKWKYNYGESAEHVLFGDWQICFQTYVDLYQLDPRKDGRKIARALEVMDYQMRTAKDDYWWWADGLYMVMPLMVKLHKVTGERRYLDKLQEYFLFADQLMFDAEAGLYYRDAKYVYPKHKSANGGKDFWARGDGWVFAGLAKVLAELPKTHASHALFLRRYQQMAKALKASQQPEGYWTRSILDPAHAPGRETSGTAFFTYGYLWGINNGILDRAEYTPVVNKSWTYLSKVALQPNGKLGYIQPIGERAILGQVVNQESTAPFGVGAFLLAAAEMHRFLER
ncbi:BNR-4 repeat-containing protein [Massilia glaciei]|uniref:BNR-4 repeat-containing protein n=1 Tax=Massilia glaciei TaxID=1524097 RepID=UPI001E53B443|nr:BNR-4 repeat-containing protein [Massilia glaciei]